ncbi:PP2C family protein-serine/threonine phosphatase [Streptomyces sp. ITFR-6]|uniref:PP2C family protein-serine/threonine phosphatase n=1 Tax=Streptomyces sp. ITFR-6 TaxID=3075197 RepID=UPI00288A11F7|nr:PP2C family protein-serine/threonine phosphatase [Streptomyces sp. ITFR-6]WNI27753.1 PP2C family protein-serine/threonine phosphatase [Streptomyces sp. ITFR-6]
MNVRTEIERAVRAAAPHALVETVRGALAAAYDARSVELLLADYGMTVLKPVGSTPGRERTLSMHNSPQGRTFGSQLPHEEPAGRDGAVDHHFPVTVRGERLGILTVRLPAGGSTPRTMDELAQVADLLGHEIIVAERDTDLYQGARRIARLTLAAEMQWQLLPARAFTAAEYAIGAQLEPAYAIHGDNFDWAADGEQLTVSVTNGMGEGIQASLLTNLAVNALRNARRAGIGIADQAALADQALYDQHRGAAHVSTLLLRFDLATGTVGAVDAGSPQLWRLRGRKVARIELDAQLPLGMFEESRYDVQYLQLVPGDRLLLVSDGVYDTVSPLGEPYVERGLARAVLATRLLPAASVPGAVLRELADYRESDPLDDALVVCIDWFGGHDSGG